MRYPKLREIKGALKSLFTKPYTAKFPKGLHIPFISFRGKTYYHQDECIGCTACVNVCPTGALSAKDITEHHPAKRILRIDLDVCISCGQCQLNCPTEEGIKLSQEFDISTTENRGDLYQMIEKEMVLCAHCNEPIACKDHVLWTVKKLGPLYVSNTALIAYQQNISSMDGGSPKDKEEFSRSDRFRLLCPRCRREAVLTS